MEITKIVELVIKAGAIIKKYNEKENSLLLLACNLRHNEIALVLLANDAEENEKDENGRTSLHTAAEDGNVELIKILMEHDADLDIPMNNGMTPIYIACRENRLEAVKMLFSCQADINKCDAIGWSPLHVSTSLNHKEVVAYLCDHDNAEINLSNKKGDSPLQFACKNCNEDLVQLI
ncbi:unnamed protein product [Mytilus coruscus]|uniref:Uncharacterized protein n=1 Tax=Mytilus coruscus TaxID=42192 RepID=A0A6J8A0E4_MYTCO|nr:unnamed protein product [Mytilus coruscus]